jgi:hypothetical protein
MTKYEVLVMLLFVLSTLGNLWLGRLLWRTRDYLDRETQRAISARLAYEYHLRGEDDHKTASSRHKSLQ